MNKKFYITAAIPYVNAAPHIGHALEFVQTDTIARYHRLLGEEVLMLSGGDENALKNVQAAEQARIPIQKFVDQNTEKFFDLTKALNCHFDVWQKGSNQTHHYPSSQKLWTLCQKDIYQKTYSGLYCVGCEAFYTPDELDENGECFEHPGKKLEQIEEENYFFRLSKYQQQLKNIISDDKVKIIPEKRKKEVLAFIERGLEDISISRSNKRAHNWGVPVPNDPTQRIYVWFDALNIYQSGIGFGWDEKKYQKWWPADVHVIGKGIVRFHAVYWLAFLLAANLQLPKTIFIHEYFTVNGQKMSKTIGNVIDPFELIKKYGADPLRYYFLAQFSPFSDGDFSEAQFKKTYNADLANGLGNLVARASKLVEKYCDSKVPEINRDPKTHSLITIKHKTWKKLNQFLSTYQFNLALAAIWEFISFLDKYINDNKPWVLAEKNRPAFNWVIYGVLDALQQIAWQIYPFLPQTACTIGQILGVEKLLTKNPLYKDSRTYLKPGTKITSLPPLFPRVV